MLLISNRGIKRSRRSIMVLSLQLFAALTCLLLFVTSSASGQGVATYSDAWYDDADNNTVGSGVTEADYDSGYHSAGVDTTLYSPNGRRAFRSSVDERVGTEFWYAEADPELFTDWGDLGEFIVRSSHYSTCPRDNFGGTSFFFPISLKKTAFRLMIDTASNCFYNGTCSGACNPLATTYVASKLYEGPCPGPYIQCKELYAAGVCYQDTRACEQQNEEGTCDQ